MDEKRSSPFGALLALTGLNLFNYLDRQILPAVVTPLKNDLHFSDNQVGSVQSAFMLGYFVTSPIFGYLGDRLSRRWLIALGVLVWSAGTVLSGTAGTFFSLICFRILVGLGEASYGTISPSWIADLYPPAKRNNMLSIFYVAIPVGSALGYLLGGFVATKFGWRSAFLWAGAPGLLLALGLLFMREPKRGASDEKKSSLDVFAVAPLTFFGLFEIPEGIAVYLRLLWIPDYVLTVAGYVAQTFALGAFALWGPTFLCRVHGMELDKADGFFGEALVVTGLLATLSGGLIATAWHKRNPAGYAWVLAISIAFSVPTSFAAFLSHDAFTSKVALAASMFFIFVSTGPTNTLILETVPVTKRATAMAASIFAIHLFGDLPSPKIVGSISDTAGLGKAVLILPWALLASTILWLCLALRMQSSKPAATAV